MSKDMERDSILFYRSFYEAICGLPKNIQLEIYTAIMEYGLNGKSPEKLGPVAKGIFTLIKPIFDSNNVRLENGKKGAEFGKRGGRPKKKAASAQTEPTYSLSFEQEVEQMKTDAEWSAAICKDYALSPEEYAEHLHRFLEHCRKARNGKLHDSFDDAKSHLRYWLDKGGRRSQQRKSAPTLDNIPPDYEFDGGFGGQDN